MEAKVEENGVEIDIGTTVQAPKKKEIIYNTEMRLNRSFVFCALRAYLENTVSVNKRIRCLDALGATGVAGLMWAKHFPMCEVTINDSNEKAVQLITCNSEVNNLSVQVVKEDVNILLLRRPFDFIFLDCYGSSVQYLDAAFHHVPKNGILVIHSTDDAALYGKAVDVTLRNYGGYVAKTCYSKELAARLILASIVRAAAKCNKGIEVLCSLAIKSHITVVIKVLRGPAAATKCMQRIRKIIHCCICEDRAIYPQSIHPVENPYSLLSCICRNKSSGQVAMELGPIWTGSIFDHDFCSSMLSAAQSYEHNTKLLTILQTIVSESTGGLKVGVNISSPANDEDSSSQVKKMKVEDESTADRCPPFYFNLHKHSPKGQDLFKMKRIISLLQSSGYKASRTHFDPEAIRTSATLAEFVSLLIQLAKKNPS